LDPLEEEKTKNLQENSCKIYHEQDAYETDEEEFLRTGDNDTGPAVLTSFTTLNLKQGPVKTKNTAKWDLSATRRMKIPTHAQGYFLAYFNLWWKRMEVEGRKDAKQKGRMEEGECRMMIKKSKNIKKENARNEQQESRVLDGTCRLKLSKELLLLEVGRDTTLGKQNTVVGVGEEGEMPNRKIIYEHSQDFTDDGKVAEQFLDGTRLMGEDLALGVIAISLRGEGGGGERESGSDLGMEP
jgi:hypothetical protein